LSPDLACDNIGIGSEQAERQKAVQEMHADGAELTGLN
jgi:hypothetical protein